jgi:hypothetical protein
MTAVLHGGPVISVRDNLYILIIRIIDHLKYTEVLTEAEYLSIHEHKEWLKLI